MGKKWKGGNGKLKKLLAFAGTKGTSRPIAPKQPTSQGFFSGVPAYAHQFGLNDEASRLDVIVGVDFGTSATKIVIHIPTYPGRPAFAVPFGNLAHESLEYLLPTRIFVDDQGACQIAFQADAAVLTDIKIGLMKAPKTFVAPASGPSYNVSAEAAATAYLAYVLQYARGWFIASKRDAFGAHVLSWSWNLGLPAAIDDNPALRDTFETVGRASWVLSRREEPITIKSAQQAIGDVRYKRVKADETPFDFGLVPEVIAEVTGYARSPLRNRGLHLLLDVGASTLDVCSFNVAKEDGEDYYPIYTADVDLLGSHRLHAARMEGAMNAVKAQVERTLDVCDPLAILPDAFDHYVPPPEMVTKAAANAQSEFLASCNRFIAKTLADLKKKRDPHSERWRSQLPIFFCGGASASRVYRDVVAGIDDWLKRNHRQCQGARLIRLPKPKSLEADIDDADYHRLAVAWGLSHSIENIGTYDRPSEIEDVPTLAPRRYEDFFISKDVV